jgi:four helix bundle protein
MSAPYEKLAAWRFCHELALAVRIEAGTWDAEDRFLANQIRRASHSAASNIAEGSSKRGISDFRRFLDYSLGSLAEVEYDLRFALDARIIRPDRWESLDIQRRKAHGTTRLLFKAISARADSKGANNNRRQE